jgi:hypothetical protein
MRLSRNKKNTIDSSFYIIYNHFFHTVSDVSALRNAGGAIFSKKMNSASKQKISI